MSDQTVFVTVNDRLSDLSAFLKTKDFGWAFIRTACLIVFGQKHNIQKAKEIKSVRQVDFSQKSQNFFQNSFQN